jgi:PepSY-associated TM region
MLLLRRLIILSHRYLGIAISLMCVVWFASGIVMMYAGGMPRVTEQARLEGLTPLDLSKVRVTPADAAQRLDPERSASVSSSSSAVGASARSELLTVLGRPAYRFQGRGFSGTVFADTGEVLHEVDVATARNVASRFLDVPTDRIHFERTLTEPDQWTLGNRGGPLYKFNVDDDAGTEIYVSPATADVAQMTTRSKRALAWLGTIPHWLYFTALKTNQPLWYELIVWLSALASVLAGLGLILAFTQFRRTRPFRLSKAIPYRGWMRWHYLLGAVFGVFALTWAFSGLVSMEPWDWTNAEGLEIPRDALSGGETDLSRFGTMDAAAFGRVLDGRTLKAVGFTRIHDEYYYTVASTEGFARPEQPLERLHQPYLVDHRGEPGRLLVAAQSLEARREPFSTESILERLKSAVPDVPIVEHTLLSDYDSYYYSRGGQSPLPVLRVKFGDPMQTWVYIDPRTSEMLSQVQRYSRIERWLYNGLHSLDFKFWYSKRPLWDIGMIVLLLGGLGSSALGLYLGVKRLLRDLGTKVAPSQPIVAEVMDGQRISKDGGG